MGTILSMASDFIDRMCNPSYGLKINEEYTLRFAAFYSHEGFEGKLHEEIQLLDDVNSFSGHGWIWILGMVRSKRILLNENLLISIALKWQDVFMQAAVIDLVIQQTSYEEREVYKSIEKTSWMTRLIEFCIETPELSDNNKESREEIDTSLAEHVLIALLQVNKKLSIETAIILLHTDWAGKEKLQNFFRSRLMLVDDETKEQWGEEIDFK